MCIVYNPNPGIFVFSEIDSTPIKCVSIQQVPSVKLCFTPSHA